MANFNTNQARHMYVALDVKTLSSHTIDPATVLTTPGDIAVNVAPDAASGIENIYFTYYNADGIITRSDMIDVKKIQYITAVEASDLVIPLKKTTVTLASGVTRTNLKGKHIQLTVKLHEYIGLDYSESYPITIDLFGDNTNTASDAAFYAALESELNDAIAGFKNAPFAVSSSGAGLVITEKAQQWVPDKFTVDPIHFDVYASVIAELDAPWASVVNADSGTSITGDYTIADLERFTHRERSEVLGMTAWPYNYEPKYLVNPVAGVSTYGMLTIQYYYSGEAEDIQKSPRTLQIAASDEDITAIKAAIDAVIHEYYTKAEVYTKDEVDELIPEASNNEETVDTSVGGETQEPPAGGDTPEVSGEGGQ